MDEFWNGMGCSLMAVGVLQLWRNIRYRTDESYREQVDVANSDERNKFLSQKAWAWTGCWFVLIGAIGTLGFKIAGLDQLSTMCGGSVCLILVLYWVMYLYLRKKY